MTLKPFGNELTREDSYSLPWLEEYIKLTGDKEAIEVINGVTFSEKGAMVYTNRYKAFIRAQRSTYADLQEAMPAFVEAAKPLPVLFCSADRNKRPVLLQDDEKLSHRWFHSEGRYTQVITEGKQFPSAEKRVNPLLSCLGTGDTAAETFSAPSAGASTGETKVRAGKTR